MGKIQKPTICEICFEEKLAVKESIYKKKTKCWGSHYFCQDCISTHILYKIQANTPTIRCPGVECKAVMDPLECRSIITRDSFVEWCRIMVDNWIARKGYRRAVCPYEECSEEVIDECKGEGRQECPSCKRLFCFGCGVKWETNHHERCRFEEVVFLNAARQGNLRRCPNCRFFVQRTTGCYTVTCRCGTSFCHKCGARNCRCSLVRFFIELIILLGLLALVMIFFYLGTLQGRNQK